MAQKPKTRKDHVISLCAGALMLFFGAMDIRQYHGALRFGTGIMIGLALVVILREVRELLEYPN